MIQRSTDFQSHGQWHGARVFEPANLLVNEIDFQRIHARALRGDASCLQSDHFAWSDCVWQWRFAVDFADDCALFVDNSYCGHHDPGARLTTGEPERVASVLDLQIKFKRFAG